MTYVCIHRYRDRNLEKVYVQRFRRYAGIVLLENPPPPLP